MQKISLPTTERIESLDLLRGIALLGILIINIQSFAMPQAAYLNPTVWGSLDGLNGFVWGLSHFFFDQKMMAIFSILFGAGIILFTERSQSPLKYHYRRNFWLLVFGLIHAYLFWYGDVLVAYALSAFFIYPFRNLSVRKLFVLSILFLSVASIFYTITGFSLPFIPQEVIEQEFLPSWTPTKEMISNEIIAYQGGWIHQIATRANTALEMQTFVFIIWAFWRTAGLMFMGMGLYRLGVLTGNASERLYRSLLLLAVLIGFPLVGFGIYWNFKIGWTLESMFLGSQFNYWGSLFISLGWIALIVVLQGKHLWQGFSARLCAVGRMAFTNYIMQSLILGFIFYGHGLGLFSEVDRVGQFLIVIAIWTFQLCLSPWWLSRFHYGPLEWLWRSLTYYRRFSFKKV